MRYVVLLFALFYGLYYYGSRHFEFHDTLVYARAHKKSPWSAPIEYYVGVVYHQRAEYAKAQESLAALVEDHPEDSNLPRALIILGDSAEYTQDWETARSALNQYIEKFPNGRDIALAKSRLELLNYKHGAPR